MQRRAKVVTKVGGLDDVQAIHGRVEWSVVGVLWARGVQRAVPVAALA